MLKLMVKEFKFCLIILTLLIGFYSPSFYAQTHFTCTLINDSLTAPNVYESVLDFNYHFASWMTFG